MSRIAIIGSGVVGEATGKGLAHFGHAIVFVDTNPEVRLNLKKQGYEVADITDLARIKYETSILCLPTPFQNNKIDLGYYEKALPYLGEKISSCEDYHLVVVRSTMPPNTTERFLIPLLEEVSHKAAGKDFGICVNPEFLRQKSSHEDFLHPRVIVIGSPDERSNKALRELYSQLIKTEEPPVITTDLKTAEIIKYAQNLYNATKISFSNEIWSVCRKLKADADIVMGAVVKSAEGMWNPEYGTKGGYPYNGHCLPKDTRGFLAYARQELNIDTPLLEAVIEINDFMENQNSI